MNRGETQQAVLESPKGFVGVNTHAPGDPLYARIAASLRHRILVEEGLSAGDVIPPERVLVEEFGVSRITLRRAIDLLVDEHILVRRRGLGTFVAAPKVPYPLLGLHSTRDIARAHGLSLNVRILNYEIGRASKEERAKLELPPRKPVVRFVRQDLLEEQPLSIAECVLPGAFASILRPDELARHSTYDLIESDSEVRISRARQILLAAGASKSVGRLLRVPTNYPLFVIDRVTYGTNDVPVEWGRISYPNENIECLVELFREPANRQERATGFVLRFLPTRADEG
jgi:GntR family transcriptional regulator